MQKRYVLFFLIASVSISCGNNQSGEEKPVEKKTAAPPVYKMDILEKMFNNDNWMKVRGGKAGGDTSYFYFSRIPSEIKVYEYKMVKGDSVMSGISEIKFAGDSIVWAYNDSTRFFLNAISNTNAQWTSVEYLPGTTYMAYHIQDEKTIRVVVGDGALFLLTKTLPLSTFLIRSRYDYLNGTHYAFIDTVFSTGKKN